MQYTVVMSGIGGQGMVVGTKLIGHAATAMGRYCLHYAQYGGEMRGTKCECTMTISDEQVNAPPLVSQTDIAIIMHPESFASLRSTVAPGGLAIVNSSLIHPEASQLREDVEWLLLPVTDVGKSLGHVMVATMVAISAFAVETGLVDVAHIRGALTEVIPPYRQQLLEMDDAGLIAGSQMVSASRLMDRESAAINESSSSSGARVPVRIPAKAGYMFSHVAAAAV